MKHIIITIIATLAALSSWAQEVTDSTRLNFEEPLFLTRTYFEEVKAHLSKEGRTQWKGEWSARANVMLLDGSVMLTGGIRTSPNKVFGLGTSWGQRFFIYGPTEHIASQRMTFFLYHRHYIPFGRNRRLSVYSDMMGGGMYIYKMPEGENHTVHQGDFLWWGSWQPGLSVRMWGKSNFFFGPSLGPTFGFHAGIAI